MSMSNKIGAAVGFTIGTVLSLALTLAELALIIWIIKFIWTHV